MKKISLLILAAMAMLPAFAQQDAMFTHYAYNTIAVNSGYAGSRDALTVTLLGRHQWVGFDGAPKTGTLTLHTPLFNEKVGAGLSIISDEIGPTKMTSVYGDFAYKIKFGKKAKLAFGLKAGVNLRSNNLGDINVPDASDPSFTNIQSDVLPNFGFGLYYSTDRYYIGASIPKLLQNNFTTGVTTGGTNLASEQRHYFLIAGTYINITENVKVKPTTMLKVTAGVPMELDLTAEFIFFDKFWAGPMYRTGDAAGALIGMNIFEMLSLGYSYDWSFGNKTMVYNTGSHEIMLRYDFIYNDKAKIRSPRYF